jgi:hypothetical protein
MAATFRPLALAPDERTTAFAGLVAWLRGSPDLRRVGATIVGWDKGPEDAIAEPADAALPWWRLTQSNEPAEWGPQWTLDSPMLVRVEQVVGSCVAAEGFRAWRAIERRLFGLAGSAAERDAALAALVAVGISGVDVLQPAGGLESRQDAAGPDPSRQRSEGLLRLKLYVPMPGVF